MLESSPLERGARQGGGCQGTPTSRSSAKACLQIHKLQTSSECRPARLRALRSVRKRAACAVVGAFLQGVPLLVVAGSLIPGSASPAMAIHRLQAGSYKLNKEQWAA